MTPTHKREPVVLALYPATRGFGYAFFEGAHQPVDWGAKQVTGNKNFQSLKRLTKLLRWLRPDVVVLEAAAGAKSRKSGRIRKLIERIKKLLKKKGIHIITYTRLQIQDCFSRCEAVTKDEIAQAIANELPEFKVRLPRKRKPWMPETYSMMIFDAVALAFTFYCSQEKEA